MSLTTYSELQASIATWLTRSDLTDQIVEFITLAEGEFNRTLFVPERETTSTSTVTADTLALPSDFWSLRSIYLNADPRILLQQMNLNDLYSWHAEQTTGRPSNFAIAGGDTLVFGPTPDDSYDIIITYWATIPALSVSNTTNWLLTGHPDIYLYGALVRGTTMMGDYGSADRWGQMYAAALGQLESAGHKQNHGANPQRIRSAYTV